MLRVLDLFSGIGGFSLGLERTGGFETVAFCEIEKYPQQVLRKHWPDVPIYEDVRTLNADGLGRIDCITGGYPCQPFSVAGERRGAEDDRHLWPEVARLMDEIRPRWGIFENVYGHISMGLDEVLSDLENLEYTAQAFVIPACAVDAPHRRDRVWIVAHDGRQQRSADEREPDTQADGRDDISGICAGKSGYVGHTKRSGQSRDNGDRLQGCAKTRNNGENRAQPRDEQPAGLRGIHEPLGAKQARWIAEPAVGRVAYGIPNRVDRLKGLGNAAVPQIPEMIGRAILEIEQCNAV